MFSAQFRLVLMVKKDVRGETFEEAAVNAGALTIKDVMKGNLLKCEVQDWGLHLAYIEEDGQYTTD